MAFALACARAVIGACVGFYVGVVLAVEGGWPVEPVAVLSALIAAAFAAFLTTRDRG